MTILPKPFRGIICPIVTPLLDYDTLDRLATTRHVESLIQAGVIGIFALGTTGEGLSLSCRLRKELVEHICKSVEGRIPVLVSITDTSFVESLRMAEYARNLGASAVVVAPPYYFSTSQSELLRYVEKLSVEVPLPLYLYNIPIHTKTHYAPETVRRAADLPNVLGLKDSSGDLNYLSEVVKALACKPDFSILCGPEELLVEALALGAHGGVCGGSNLFPELFVELFQAAAEGDRQRIEELRSVVLNISANIYHAVPGDSSYLRGMKRALSLLGKCGNVMAEPYEPFGAEVTAMISRGLAEICALRS